MHGPRHLNALVKITQLCLIDPFASTPTGLAHTSMVSVAHRCEWVRAFHDPHA